MRERIERALAPASLEIIDESERHRGHAGYRPGGETHFKVMIVSDKFLGMRRIERARLVHDLLREELGDRIHALSLNLKTPDEVSV